MKRKAFTLIELLIVVLIIAILAAIAIPNFMEFQTRAKVSRVKSDIRTMATGVEAYCVDEGTYPASMADNGTGIYYGLFLLTTPIAYLSTIPRDPFGDKEVFGEKYKDYYEFGCGKVGVHASLWINYPNDTFMLESAGPDNLDSTFSSLLHGGWRYPSTRYPWAEYPTRLTMTEENIRKILHIIYDPTNGTASDGNIYRTGGLCPDEPLIRMWWQAVNSK